MHTDIFMNMINRHNYNDIKLFHSSTIGVSLSESKYMLWLLVSILSSVEVFSFLFHYPALRGRKRG